jgi:hypothetical protein
VQLVLTLMCTGRGACTLRKHRPHKSGVEFANRCDDFADFFCSNQKVVIYMTTRIDISINKGVLWLYSLVVVACLL